MSNSEENSGASSPGNPVAPNPAPESESAVAPASGGIAEQVETADPLAADAAGEFPESGALASSDAAPELPGTGPALEAPPEPEFLPAEPQVSYTQTVDDAYGYYQDPYAYGEQSGMPAPVAAAASSSSAPPPPPPPPQPESSEDDDDGMLRMSFLEHLEELRSRLLKALAGLGVAFVASLAFTNQLWLIVSDPAIDALKQLGFKNPGLTQITPMETFSTVWVKLPILCAVFLASPWILYQVWAFIAPGLYKKERRFAAPFVICSAGLFILGGLFGYFVAFRFGLVFLLGIGRDINIIPMVSVSEYFDLFVNVILGIGVVFEIPILMFFLTLLRILSPKFLFDNSRYAILGIVILAAVITPTPDVFNLLLFATPMVLLFFIGLFACYLLTLQRDNKKFPWGLTLMITGGIGLLIGGALFIAVRWYGYHIIQTWPFLTR